MAVGWSGEFGQDFPPPMAISLALHRQFQRGFAARSAPHRRPPKESPAQGVQLALLQLPQPPLQQHAQVVSRDGQVMQRLRSPKVLHTQPLDSELFAQLLDPVLQVRPPVVAPPHRQGPAASANLRVAPHLWAGAPAFAAGLHFAAACPAAHILEYSVGANPMIHDLVEERFTVEDGLLAIPDRPGLGITVRDDFVRRYAVA